MSKINVVGFLGIIFIGTGSVWAAESMRKTTYIEFPTLHDAVLSGNWFKVRNLLAQGACVNKPFQESWRLPSSSKDALSFLFREKATPLHCAVEFSQSPRTVFELIKGGANLTAKTEQGGSTPLHWAVRNHDSMMVGSLVLFSIICKKGAPYYLWYEPDHAEKSPLDLLRELCADLKVREIALNKIAAKAMQLGHTQPVENRLGFEELQDDQRELDQINKYYEMSYEQMISSILGTSTINRADIHTRAKALVDQEIKMLSSVKVQGSL